MAYLSSKFLVIFELKPTFIFKNFAILLVDTYALIISLILSGKLTIGPRRLSNISKAVIKSAISKK